MGRPHSPLWPDRLIKPPYGSAEVDPSHPLAQGLVNVLLLNEPAGPPRALPYPDTFAVTGMLWHPLGLEKPASVSSSAISVRASMDLMGPLSLILDATFLAFYGSTTYCVMGLGSGTLASGGHLGINQVNTSNKNFEFKKQGGTNGYSRSANAVLTAGVRAVMGATWDGSTTFATGVGLYLDGKPLAPATTVDVVTPGTGLDAPMIGGTNAALTSDIVIHRALWYNRVLAPDLMAWLYAEPYAMLRPIKRRAYGFASATPPAGWKPAWLPRQPRTVGTGVI